MKIGHEHNVNSKHYTQFFRVKQYMTSPRNFCVQRVSMTQYPSNTTVIPFISIIIYYYSLLLFIINIFIIIIIIIIII